VSTCARCGVAVAPDDGFRVIDLAGDRHAVLCRLEHAVPWVMRGPAWAPGPADAEHPDAPDRCAHCGAAIAPGAGLLLVRHRGPGVAVADRLCSPDHLRAWALAGGRWG
jgi:hypothetical protein